MYHPSTVAPGQPRLRFRDLELLTWEPRNVGSSRSHIRVIAGFVTATTEPASATGDAVTLRSSGWLHRKSWSCCARGWSRAVADFMSKALNADDRGGPVDRVGRRWIGPGSSSGRRYALCPSPIQRARICGGALAGHDICWWSVACALLLDAFRTCWWRTGHLANCRDPQSGLITAVPVRSHRR